MIQFKEFQTDTFKKKLTSSQLVFVFVSALGFIDEYIRSNPPIERLNSQISADRFSIKLRFRNVECMTFPIKWFACQSSAYRVVNTATRVNIRIEPCVDIPSFYDLTYELFVDKPLPF